MTSGNKKLAFEKLIKRLAQGTSATIAYGAAILATIALAPNIQLPPNLANLAGGIGVGILSDVLIRMAKGEEISNEDLLKQINMAIVDLNKTLKSEEFFNAYSHLLEKFRDNHDEHQEILRRTDEIIKLLNNNIELTPEQESYYLDKYLEEIQRYTKRLPWGHTLSAISPDLEISEIYVSPSFSVNEGQRTTTIIIDEKQERDQERRDKETQTSTLQAKRSTKFSVYDLLESSQPVAIVGYMGTGKSLTSNYIAWYLSSDEDFLEFPDVPKRKVPILIKLGDPMILKMPDLAVSIFDLATTRFTENDRKFMSQILREEWKKGNVALVLDALDEFSGISEWIKDEIDFIVEGARIGNRVILTSRPSAYLLIKPAGFKHYKLEEIELNDIERYARKWVGALAPLSDKNDVVLDEHVAFLMAQISNHPLVESMVANPLLLTILVALSLTKDGVNLSDVKNETDLYQKYVDYIIERDKQKAVNQQSQEISTSFLKIVFGFVGLLIQEDRTGLNPQFPNQDDLVNTISSTRYFVNEPGGRQLVEKCIEFWKKTNLLVADNETINSLSFRHQAFQYFGAALGIKYLSFEKQKEITDRSLNNPQWSDVLRLFSGIKSIQGTILE